MTNDDITKADARLREATANIAGKAATMVSTDKPLWAMQRLEEARNEWEVALDDLKHAVWVAARDDLA